MSVRDWLDDRLRYRAAETFFHKKEVPIHRHAVGYYTGGTALFFFVIQVITGLLLLMYYRPTSDAAYESVRFITSSVRFGWLVRSVHVWSANLMVLAVFAHLAVTFFGRAYRRPREVTWITGALLLLITLTFAFTGYLLPWNTLAYFATKVGTEIAGDVPVIGKAVLVLLRGSEDVTEATLTRFFGIHVAILPALITIILGLHLALIQIHGLSRPPGVMARRSDPFYPDFVLRDLMVWMVLLGVLAILATLIPWSLGEKADPLAPAPVGIKPEWYFLFMYQALRFFPSHILGIEGEKLGVLVFVFAGAMLMLVPFLDVWAQRERSHPAVTAIGIGALLFVVVMTIIGMVVAV